MVVLPLKLHVRMHAKLVLQIENTSVASTAALISITQRDVAQAAMRKREEELWIYEVANMAEREVTVEITATYITKVIAGSASEAAAAARNLVHLGVISPHETNVFILDVQPIKEVT